MKITLKQLKMLEIKATHQFMKDLKTAKKRGLDIAKLNEVTLPEYQSK